MNPDAVGTQRTRPPHRSHANEHALERREERPERKDLRLRLIRQPPEQRNTGPSEWPG